MIRKLLVPLCLIGLTTAAVIVDASLNCDCTELNQTDCTSASDICLWNSENKECQEFTLDCTQLKTQTSCDEYDACEWKNASCVVWTRSCTDGTTAALCNELDECYWNKNNTCDKFSSCANYSEEECPEKLMCSVSSGACVDYKFVTCSTFKSSETCTGFDSNTTECAWADDNTCKSLKRDYACSDLNNFKTYCEDSYMCKYEGSTCRGLKCSDMVSVEDCDFINSGDSSFTLCTWANSACAEAADTSSLTSSNCYSRTFGNYKWSSDNKCVVCEVLVGGDNESNQFIMGAFAILLVLLN